MNEIKYIMIIKSIVACRTLEAHSFRTSPYILELYLYDVHFFLDTFSACKCKIYVQFPNKCIDNNGVGAF